jgi:hypothetical protein
LSHYCITCLSLPFLEIVQSYLPTPRAIDQAVGPDELIPGHPGLKTLLAIDVFIFNFGSQTIRTRERHELQRSPGVSQYAINLFKNNYLILHAFFFTHILKGPRSANHSDFRSIDLTSFCQSFFRPAIPPLSQPPQINSIEHYKSLIPTKTSSIPLMSPKQWKNFWKIQIPLPARTIWYRTIHNKIPTKVLLHKHTQSKHPSPNCPLCSSYIPTRETLDHFIFECPLKFHVWQTIYYAYIRHSLPSPPPNRITLSSFYLLLHLSFSTVHRTFHPLFPKLTSHQIFACTLQCVWQAHWRFVFDDIPFRPSKVLKSIARLLTQLDSELQLDSNHGHQ